MEEPEANSSGTQENNSLIERAVRSFVDILSNAQPKIQVSSLPQAHQRSAITTTRGDMQSHQPPARLQTTAHLQPPAQQQAASSVQREMLRSFPAFYQGRKNRGKRPFPSGSLIIPAVKQLEFNFCLMPESTNKTPKNEIRLLQAGLGRRTISINDSADHEEITRVLTEEYPKMKNLTGGWLLYKAAGGSGQRTISVVAQGYTAKMLKSNTINGKHPLYIVPLQEKFDTTPLPPDAAEFCKMPKSQCKSCGKTLPLQLLVIHIETCGHESDSEQLQEGEVEKQHEADVEDQVQCTCPVCGGQYPADLLPYHASSCGESAPEDLPSSSSSSDRARPHRSQEEHDSISTPDLDAERMGVDTHEAWKTILCPQAAATLFKRHLLRKNEVEPPIRASVDIREDQESQSREILAFYKSPQVDWARPLRCTLQGDAAVGVGVQRHFLSLAMFKLQHGFNINSGVSNITLLFEGEQDHLLPATSQILVESNLFVVAGRMIGHSFLHGGPVLHGFSEAIIHMLLHGDVDTATIYLADVADLDLRETIHMLDGDELLSDQQTNEINNLAFSWDLPAIKPVNRRWLFQQLMQHAVIGRRTKQIKQIRKGLKDTKVWTLLKEKPETARIVFPRQANAFPTAQAILSLIVWPRDDSDDDEDEDDSYPRSIQDQTAGFLRKFIETASPSQLEQLTKFWVGWEIPTDTLKVRVVKGAYLKSSTCFGTLHVPGHFQNYEDFSKHVESCIATYVTGFGLV
ncbi:uncharacterized protein isoform X6 [Notothenia coriiceps]|uniref:Uncharacterized protein isoform X6 n=1 Tax=Notothenia coriiceps TaxID=8208 RepID=A0A6I9NHJ8_9TELE|nr:PREDICTED: uncharacterized protein LOC104949296 isoform X6 [Notothenia coriiceps]